MVITVVPPKAIVDAAVASVRTTFAALNAPAVTPLALVTVTVFNALAWPTLDRVIAPVDSKVRF